MAHLENDPEAKQPGRNRLGKLFSSLVDGDTLPDVVSLYAEKNESASRLLFNQKRSKLDIEDLSKKLALAQHPLEVLQTFVRDALTHASDETTPTSADAADALKPSDYKLHLTKRLQEAGINVADAHLAKIRIIRLRTSGLFYIRTTASSYPYLTRLRLLEIESALNIALLANHYFLDANMVSKDDLLLFERNVLRSITSQAPASAARSQDGTRDGEWIVRKAISLAIENLRLPYRLELDFRTNVHAGRAAFRIKLIPPEVFPKTHYQPKTGEMASTEDVLKRAATDYNTRLGILVTASAFNSSQTIRDVWIEGITEDPVKHCCLYTAHITRNQFEDVRLTDISNPVELLLSWGASINSQENILSPVKPSFSLEDERFCPPSRYDTIEDSTKSLASEAARALGTTQVSGLSIDEGEHREVIATEILRNLSSSTEENVRMVLSLTAQDKDSTVRTAGERIVARLIDGTLSESDMEAVGAEFVNGGTLQAAVTQARALIAQKDFADAEKCLLLALNDIDATLTYADNETTCWRVFTSYVDRVLYNRLLDTRTRTTKLAPTAYFDAHLLTSIAELLQAKTSSAIAHARRAAEVAPLSTSARLHLAHCLEATGQLEEAIEVLKTLLTYAHDPEGIGFGYYRMAFFQWRVHNYATASACYQYALRFLPGAMFLISTEMRILAIREPHFSIEELTDEQIRRTLAGTQIPIAPTPEVSEVFMEGTRASLDAELFSVAKSFMTNLGIMTKDDIYYDMLRSIESEPDR